MRKRAKVGGARLLPAMRYRNVSAAIQWLCAAFGFEPHRIVKTNEGAVVCAHLTLGSDMITVWSVRDSCLDGLMKQPDEIGGAETQSCYLIVENADTHHHSAKAAGADIILDLADDDHGGRGYSCRDLEGHIWSFGTYDPWQEYPNARAQHFSHAPGRGLRVNRHLIMAAALALAAAAIAGGMFHWQPFTRVDETRLKLEAIAAHDRAEMTTARAAALNALLTQERSANDVAKRAADDAREQLAHEQDAKKSAEHYARQLEEQVVEERRTKDVAKQMAKDASDQIAKLRTAKEAAERTTSDTTKELMRERYVKQQAERSAQESIDQLARVSREKEAAERAAKEAEKQLAAAHTGKRTVARSAKGRSAGQSQNQNTNAPAANSSEPTIPSLVP